MKKRNVKTVQITIPNEVILRKVNNTPCLKQLTRSTLNVGDNFENVNHTMFGEIMRMLPMAGCTVKDVTT